MAALTQPKTTKQATKLLSEVLHQRLRYQDIFVSPFKQACEL
jgi:hypothetical protein